jgi:hypothetical protein
LTNGIIVGAGTAIRIASLIGVYALNASYVSVSSFLASDGVSTIGIQLKLEGIIELLSLCPFGFVFGPWRIALGLLSQFSERTRFEYKKKNSLITRIGGGLMGGGSVLAALSGSNFFRQFYEPASGWYELYALVTIIGIIMLATGIFLLLLRKPVA